MRPATIVVLVTAVIIVLFTATIVVTFIIVAAFIAVAIVVSVSIADVSPLFDLARNVRGASIKLPLLLLFCGSNR